ncbi:MAG: PEGA domain-containing protein [Spirochaetales bacterium]|nr:PEGA domain-containing protein [Spirochaetales bacterium]
MKFIPQNPYIVGNPIKTKAMFFGREDDFQFVIRKIGSGLANQIIVFCGDRRSGKTSILFQILNGRLGKNFLPVLIDMQILAGVKSDLEFFRTIIEVACTTLKLPGLSFERVAKKAGDNSIEHYFDAFLFYVKKEFPEKIVLFLLDEYELIEAKIRDHSLSESVIHYLAGTLESDYRISFIFTGSTNLENRKEEFWKVLLGKSIYRKISYLSRNDTYRLISDPLHEYIEYPEEILSTIYRLTGGQPFYTQVICQNLVDILMEEERNDPAGDDLKRVIKDIVANPLPQMIYSWNNLSDWTRLTLSALGGLIKRPDDWINDQQVYQFLLQSKVRLPFKRERINILLEEAYQQEFLEKNEEEKYRFKIDLFRRWIKKEHSIWKTVKEVKLELKKPINAVLTWSIIPAALALSGFLFFVALPNWFGVSFFRDILSIGFNPVKDIRIKANLAPFRVTIDESQILTSEGLEDKFVITIPTLAAGEHVFKFTHPETGIVFERKIEITQETRYIPVFFSEENSTAGQDASRKEVIEAGEVGSLFISSVPQGATIMIDGVVNSVTPQLIRDVPLGTRSIGILMEGYKPEYFEVKISKNEIIEKNIVLSASYGTLVLDVRPTARIYLDGIYLIDTPYAKPLTIATGKHIITIENENLKVKKNIPIQVNEGETISIKEDLRK